MKTVASMMKDIRIRTILGCICALSLSSILWAQEGDSGQPGAFLRYGIGGRAMGMGRAFVALSNDASGVYWNPAGIIGAKRSEFTSMYSNLYFDSQYAHFGLIVPRPLDRARGRILRFLLGPSAAIGFGWVGLSTSGYEQRTSTGVMLGNFSIGESAVMAAWAREEVQPWGILRYGINVKFVNQNFNGLEPSSEMGIGSMDRDWTNGVDIGFTFQPIHTPVLRVFSLRYLLPLRFGLTIQNFVQPVWQGADGHKDRFPRTLRYGLSYRWILKDWLPETWDVFQGWARDFYIITVLDREHIQGRKPGTYFGIEGHFPLTPSGLGLYPRLGFNNRSDGPSLGIGFALPFAASTIIRIDYAYGFHPYLPEDSRFFLTLQMGKDKGSVYFSDVSKREEIEEKERRQYLYRIVAEYPNDYVVEAALSLADVEDSTRARRYYDLTGGIGRAVWLFRETKTLLKMDKVGNAKKRAQDVAEEYAQIFIQPEHTLNDDDLLNYAEALFITDRTEAALSVLIEVEDPSLRYYYLLGISKMDLQDWEGAIDAFREAVKRYEEEQNLNSMVCISFLHMAQALFMTGQYESAIMTLEIVLKNYADRLDPDYPRYPVFRDDYVVDDAQFLLGLSYIRMGQYREGVSRLMETIRFYPDLEYGLWTDAMAETLIETVRTANWNRLDALIDQVSLEYVNSHAW